MPKANRNTYVRSIALETFARDKARIAELAASEERSITSWVGRAARDLLAAGPQDIARPVPGKVRHAVPFDSVLYIDLPGDLMDAITLRVGAGCVSEFLRRAVALKSIRAPTRA